MRRDLDRLKRLLAKAELAALTSGNNFWVRQLKSEINVLLDKEATMWAQRSRLLWVKNGDRNTKYFHTQATKRFRRNGVVGIRDEQNTWKVQPEEITKVLIDYYKALFTSATREDSTQVLACVPSVITNEMNDSLCYEFGESKVYEALK